MLTFLQYCREARSRRGADKPLSPEGGPPGHMGTAVGKAGHGGPRQCCYCWSMDEVFGKCLLFLGVVNRVAASEAPLSSVSV